MKFGQPENRWRAMASSEVTLKGKSGGLLLLLELLMALSMSVSYYYAIKPYGNYGDHWSLNTFTAYAEKNDPQDASELFETWKGRLAGMLLTGALYDHSVQDNTLPTQRVERFNETFARYHALGLLLLFLAIICALRNSLLINLGIFAGLIYNLSPLNGPNFYPWDMPAALFFTLAVILHQRRQQWLMLVVCCTGYFFKETVLATALLVFFNLDWPWRKRILAFCGAVGVCLVGKKLLLSGLHLNTAVLSMADAKTLSGLINWDFLDRNILYILSTTPNHVLFANAGTLVVVLLLVGHKRFQQYSVLIWAFVAAQMLYGTVKEFRIFGEVLPLSCILLLGYWKDWQQARSQPPAERVIPDTTWAIRGTGGELPVLAIILVIVAVTTVGARYRTMVEFQRPEYQVRAFKQLETKAGEKNQQAQYELGKRYLYGQGTATNLTTACEWLDKAAKGGNVDAALLLGQTFAERHEPVRAVNCYYWALKLDTNSVIALNGIAWIRATAADAGVRNGEEAVRLAQRACLLNEENEPVLLETLAAAYAETGRYTQAVDESEEACAKAVKNNQLIGVNLFVQMTALFQSGHPYHQPASVP